MVHTTVLAWVRTRWSGADRIVVAGRLRQHRLVQSETRCRFGAEGNRKMSWNPRHAYLGSALIVLAFTSIYARVGNAAIPTVADHSNKQSRVAVPVSPAKQKATAHTATESRKAKQTHASVPATDFVRFHSDAKGQPIALETAITHYVITAGPYKGAKVDLIGAVHIGEKSYYDQLNKQFRTYDALLYELVASEKASVPRRNSTAKSKHLITVMQTAMKDVLELQFQLDRIDYSKPNMVHADMSPTEFAKSMQKRGESFFTMFVRAIGQSFRTQMAADHDAPSDIDLLVALFSRDRALKLKRMLAKQFRDIESQTTNVFGEDSTIIAERNKKALQVLEHELEHGKRHVGIFYGAGHLRDMETRLVHDFAAKKTGQQWLVAWSLQ